MDWRRGYTIIELLIAVAIIGIMTVGGYPLLMAHLQEVRLEQAARSVYHDICLLRDATMAAGTGTGTINFICDGFPNPIPGRIMIRYEILYPGNASPPHLFIVQDPRDPPGRLCRNLASEAVAVGSPSVPIYFPASTTDNRIHTLHFNRDGLLTFPNTGSTTFTLWYFNTAAGLIETSVGSWVISIFNDPANSTGRIILRKG